MSISIVIPHANRYENLKECLKAISQQTIKPKSVIISDWSIDPRPYRLLISLYSKKIPIVFAHHKKGKFIRGLAINDGRRYVDADLIFILDADIIIDRDCIKDITKVFGKTPKNLLVSCIGRMQHPDKRTTSVWEPSKKKVFGAFMVLRTDTYDKVGGHNPFLTAGWGWQDEDFRDRLYKSGVKPKILQKYYIHMYHTPSVNSNTQKKNIRLANKSKFVNGVWIRT